MAFALGAPSLETHATDRHPESVDTRLAVRQLIDLVRTITTGISREES
jgi:hypothetical protein